MLMGHLAVAPTRTDVDAVLFDMFGNELRRLRNVQIRRMHTTGEILLRGIEVHQMRLGIAESRQAWWCQLQHERRAGEAAPSQAIEGG